MRCRRRRRRSGSSEAPDVRCPLRPQVLSLNMQGRWRRRRRESRSRRICPRCGRSGSDSGTGSPAEYSRGVKGNVACKPSRGIIRGCAEHFLVWKNGVEFLLKRSACARGALTWRVPPALARKTTTRTGLLPNFPVGQEHRIARRRLGRALLCRIPGQVRVA